MVTMTAAEYQKRFSQKPKKSGAPRKKHTSPEADEQAKLFQWAAERYAEDPAKWFNLDLMHCSLNGVKLFKGQAVKAKAQGMKKGVLDISLPVPRGRHHGLMIEMKWGSNKPTPEQFDVIERLDGMGYRVAVCWAWQEAAMVITEYYDLSPAEPLK